MVYISFLVFLFIDLNCYGQKTIDTVKGRDYSNDSWFKKDKIWDKKMGLADLLKSKDSLRIRFRDGINVVDIVMNKNGRITSSTYSYLFKLNNKNERQKVVYKKISVDKTIISEILDSLNKLDIPGFYDGYKIPGYPVTVDGITYIFEFSTSTTYKYISFTNPSEALDLKQAQAVISFSKYVSMLLNLKDNFGNLRKTLPKGKYKIGGMLIYKILQ
jgi:hypothetical protein